MSILKINDVTQNFGGLKALNSVNIEVQEGEIVGIIGPNGAGKTTLFNNITGFIKPTTGEILFREENLVGLTPEKIVKIGVARTFQGTSNFGKSSLLDNVLIAHQLYKTRNMWQAIFNTRSYRSREEEAVKLSMNILESLDLAGQKEAMAHDIPYGTQKLLGLAMALATNAQLLLLDEPVAGMNPEEIGMMSNKIRQIRDNEGKTIMLVEHNMKMTMGLCDRIVVLQFGQKIAEGTPDAIKRDQNVIEAYLGTQET
jgi:branched-chain amino acid transport system ATP-binding protein